MNIVVIVTCVLLFLYILLFFIIPECSKSLENKSAKKRIAIPQSTRLKSLTNLFKDTLDVCNKLDVQVIPSYGTLLGLVREDKIIDHDYDIDIFVSDINFKKLKQNLSLFKYKAEFKKMLWHSKILITDEKTGLMVDIIRLTENKDYVYKDTFYAPGNLEDFEWDTPFLIKYKSDWIYPLKRKDTKYGIVYLPNQSERLLVRWYGKDWKTPKSK